MRDHTLNERASLSFPFLIRRLCMHANISPNKLLDICVEAKKITKVTRINDVSNPLYGSRVGPAPPLEVLPHVSVEPIRVEGVNEKAEGTTQRMVAEQRQTRSILDQVVEKPPTGGQESGGECEAAVAK
ncbi:hypothetical protein KY289_026846 [Solanum tuberosum]|nr:hypothetical protein KY289_026846 [Solanum tuberosum]